MTDRVDVAVIGGGIAGMAHAWMAARRGLRVLLLERSAVAQAASVRNFGMIWPIGQPAGELHDIALHSRERWLELKSLGVVPLDECGSIHLAHRADELAVQEEFCRQGTHAVQMISAGEVLRRAPIANPAGLLGGMLSPLELRVDPRSACAQIARWLEQTFSVACWFGTPAVSIEGGRVRAADGRSWQADRIVLCSGSDLVTLFPTVLRTAGLVPCKLQMLKIAPQPLEGGPAPHLASGLTLRHYTAFRDCNSLKELQLRVERETPELNRWGIHILASQPASGEVVLGDSHEYGTAITPFDKSEIDGLILREASKVLRLNDWSIVERWHGVYCKHPEKPVFDWTDGGGVNIWAGLGGAGMTMAFGLAERTWQRWLGE